MLLGEYEHTLDDKNRLTLPAKFRQTMAGGVVLTRGLDSCVEAYPADDWKQLVERELAGLSTFSKESRQLERYLYSGAVEAQPDKQGRVMVPPTLLEHAGLGREVVVIGMRGRIEIWDRAAWRAQLKEVMEGAEHVAERLAAQHD
jgi:MraZ protein